MNAEIKIVKDSVEYINIEFLLRYCESISSDILESYGYDVKREAISPYDSGVVTMITKFKELLEKDYTDLLLKDKG